MRIGRFEIKGRILIIFVFFAIVSVYMIYSVALQLSNGPTTFLFDPKIEYSLEGNPMLGENTTIIMIIIPNPEADLNTFKDLEIVFPEGIERFTPLKEYDKEYVVWSEVGPKVIRIPINLNSPGIWEGYVTIKQSIPENPGSFASKAGVFYLIIGENKSSITHVRPSQLNKASIDPRKYFRSIDLSVEINRFYLDPTTNVPILNVTYEIIWRDRNNNTPNIELYTNPSFDFFTFKSLDTDYGGDIINAPKIAPHGRFYKQDYKIIFSENQTKKLTPREQITFNYIYGLGNLSYMEYRQNNTRDWKVYSVETEPRDSYLINFRAWIYMTHHLYIPEYFDGEINSKHVTASNTILEYTEIKLENRSMNMS